MATSSERPCRHVRVRRTFNGQVAVVTGAASGIGLALAERLAQAGARVTLTDLDGAAAASVAQRLRDRGLQAVGQHLDVTCRDDVDCVYADVAARCGRFDFAFNNAGVGATQPFAETTTEQWDRVLALNLRSVIDCTAAAYRLMAERGTGHIVNTASVSGLVPIALQTPYATTKFGVVGLSTTLRSEAAQTGVRVSVVCPGSVATPIWATPILGRRGESTPDLAPPGAISATKAAQIILRGVARNREVIVFPAAARALVRTRRRRPRAYARWMAAEIARQRPATNPVFGKRV